MAKKQHTCARAKRKRNAKRALDNRAREQRSAAKAAPETEAAAPVRRVRAAKKKAEE